MCNVSIKCPYKRRIILPVGVTFTVGDTCMCPQSCQDHGKSTFGCMYGNFALTDKSFKLDNAVGELSYTAEEAQRHYNVNVSAAQPSPASERRTEQTARRDAERTVTAENPPASQTAQPIRSTQGGDTKDKYAMPVFTVAKKQEPVSDEHSDTDILAPRKSYAAYELRGRYYSFGGKGNSENLRVSAVASRLFNRILSTFDIDAVFSGDTVRDDFKWVLGGTLADEQKRRVREALSDGDADRAQKFFSLFYYGIFYGTKLPLYWARGYTPYLMPIYRDERDFFGSIVGREGGRFYYNNARTVFIWLKRSIPSDAELNESAVEIQDTVALNPALDKIVFWSNGAFVELGDRREFVERLTDPDKPLEVLNRTAVFLSKYDIVRSGGDYRVVKRDAVDSECLIKPCDTDDGILERLFDSGKSVNKLEYYLYILKRYCELFNPPSVRIGGIKFEADKFTEQIEDIVSEMCAYALGDGDDAERSEKYVNALLAKILYESKAIFSESSLGRSEKYMDDVLDLVLQVNTVDFVSRCFAAFGCKPEKLRIYATDYSVMPHKRSCMSVKDFILMKIKGVESCADLAAKVASPIFAAYSKTFGKTDNGADALFDDYKRKEADIVEAVKKL